MTTADRKAYMAGVFKAGFVIITLALAAFSQDSWVRHRSVEGGFSVHIPAELMTRGTRPVEDDDGNRVTLNSIAVNSGLTRYIVTYYDVDSFLKFSLKHARDGIVSKLNGKLVADRSSRIHGFSSRTFRVHAVANGHDITLNARIFWTGNRVYLLQVIFPRTFENTPAEDQMHKFFDSFLIESRQFRSTR